VIQQFCGFFILLLSLSLSLSEACVNNGVFTTSNMVFRNCNADGRFGDSSAFQAYIQSSVFSLQGWAPSELDDVTTQKTTVRTLNPTVIAVRSIK
jgi:hypothetical protein